MDPDENQNPERISRAAYWLALAGYLPLAAMAIWLSGNGEEHPWYGFVQILLTAYGAVILSFLGGARWGMEIHRGEHATVRVLVASMIPPLAGFAAFFAPVPHVYAILAVAFAAHGAWDSISSHSDRIPYWYGRMRIVLTVLVVLALIVAFMATAYY